VPTSPCENFLYSFKAARRAARAAATAASSGTRRGSAPDGPNAGRLARKSIKAGPLGLQQVSSVRAGVPAPAARLSGPSQNPSRPSVTAGQRARRVPGECNAKTALTEPARTRRWQQSGAGTRVGRDRGRCLAFGDGQATCTETLLQVDAGTPCVITVHSGRCPTQEVICDHPSAGMRCGIRVGVRLPSQRRPNGHPRTQEVPLATSG
jgi:hypothetical protein